MLIGYARVSTRIAQDTEHQERELRALGIPQDRIYLDRGYTGKNTNRPGLALALAAVRQGDTLCVTKLDRLARSVVDAHRLAQQLTDLGALLRIGSSVYDPRDPFGKLLFTCLAMIAEFERDLISMRTRDGLETARLKGKLRGRPPKLDPAREKALVAMVGQDHYTRAEVAAIFGVAPSTVRRALDRAGQP
jgi:DNA invertase Pin-like site-specific DNA recombinase